MTRELTQFRVGDATVSAICDAPPGVADFTLVLAHGAGAGMTHSFLEQYAATCVAHGVAVFRYNFPYMEAKRARVDGPAVAFATVRAAVDCARARWPKTRIIAGGKSFGGRMTSGAQAERSLDGVVGLAFLGFPLHPPGKPSIDRAAHLAQVELPMLFCQGSRDEFATPDLRDKVIRELGSRATPYIVDGGDHSFKVPKAKGLSVAELHAQLVSALLQWYRSIPSS